MQDPRQTKTSSRTRVASFTLFTTLTLVAPMSAMQLVVLNAGSDFPGAIVLSICAAVAGVCVRHLVRTARLNRGRLLARKVSLGLSFAAAFALMNLGGMVLRAGTGAERPADGLAPLGTGLLFAGVGLVFTGLFLTPGSGDELKRRIEVEASTIALGTCLAFFFVYPSLEQHASAPSFNTFIAIGAIFASYVVAKVALRLRYR